MSRNWEGGNESWDRSGSGGGGGGGGGGWRDSGESGGYRGGRSFSNSSRGRGRGGGGGGGSFGGGGGERRSGGGYDETGEKTSMKIPSSEVGRVIGRGGSTIKDLQYKSGARIKVHNESRDNENDVDIFGSQAERDLASDMISEIIERGAAQAARGGGGGGGGY